MTGYTNKGSFILDSTTKGVKFMKSNIPAGIRFAKSGDVLKVGKFGSRLPGVPKEYQALCFVYDSRYIALLSRNALVKFSSSCQWHAGQEAKVYVDTQSAEAGVQARHLRFNFPGGVAYTIGQLTHESELTVISA